MPVWVSLVSQGLGNKWQKAGSYTCISHSEKEHGPIMAQLSKTIGSQTPAFHNALPGGSKGFATQ